MAIALVQQADNGQQVNVAISTTKAVSFGAATTSGNFLLCHVAIGCGVLPTVTGPAGWTYSGINTPVTSNGFGKVYIWHKIADGTETGVSLSASSASNWAVKIMEFSGVNTSDPFTTNTDFTDPIGCNKHTVGRTGCEVLYPEYDESYFLFFSSFNWNATGNWTTYTATVEANGNYTNTPDAIGNETYQWDSSGSAIKIRTKAWGGAVSGLASFIQEYEIWPSSAVVNLSTNIILNAAGASAITYGNSDTTGITYNNGKSVSSTSTSTTTVSTSTVTAPVAGQQLVAFLMHNVSTDAGLAVTCPGWTEQYRNVVQEPAYAGSVADRQQFTIMSKVADGTEGSTGFTFTTVSATSRPLLRYENWSGITFTNELLMSASCYNSGSFGTGRFQTPGGHALAWTGTNGFAVYAGANYGSQSPSAGYRMESTVWGEMFTSPTSQASSGTSTKMCTSVGFYPSAANFYPRELGEGTNCGSKYWTVILGSAPVVAAGGNDHWAWSEDQMGSTAPYNYVIAYDTPLLDYDGSPTGRDPGAWGMGE